MCLFKNFTEPLHVKEEIITQGKQKSERKILLPCLFIVKNILFIPS